MKKHIIFLSLLSVLFFISCKDDAEMSTFEFGTSIEQPTSDDKAALDREMAIYFEANDSISIGSNRTNTPHDEKGPIAGYMVLTTGTESESGIGYNGTFRTDLDEESSVFCAVFPYHKDIHIRYSGSSFTTVECYFPRVQKYANDESFGKNDYPMVAYSANKVLEFHSLCGIARIQFYAPAGTKYIDSIQFVADGGKKISGLFNVNNFSTSLDTPPYVTPITSGDNAGKQSNIVSIQCPQNTVDIHELKTFYLTLPATSDAANNANGEIYTLRMILYTNGGGAAGAKHVTMHVLIKRRCITKFNAIDVDQWTASSGVTGICGNGTTVRPFEIYSVNDLVKVREAFNNAPHTLNGINVTTDNYYFVIKRSDIVLSSSNWTEGIKNFRGTMTYRAAGAASASNPGIKNNSLSPLFESITSNGTVTDITIKGDPDKTIAIPSSGTFSPFCTTNDGNITGCHVASNYKCKSTTANIAGICVTNNGTIDGCGNTGSITCNGTNVAGICYTNGTNGVISECSMTSSALSFDGKEIGCICYSNSGKILDSYIASTNTTTGDWGGFAFIMDAGSIKNCQLQLYGTVSTTGTCGSIVNTLKGGEINYCQNNTRTANSAKLNGGIVATMTEGTIINCACDMGTYSLMASGGHCGGIVADMSGGKIYNSYAYCVVAATGGNTGTVVGNFRSGEINNCYGWEPTTTGDNFYGGTPSSVSIENCYNYKVAQTDVTNFTDPVDISALETLLNNYIPTGGNSWTTPIDHPTIVPPASKGKKRHIERTKKR